MRGRIVFIDDEAPLCAAAADWLEASGFEVTTFTDPRLALAQITMAECDCVVSDLRMPGMAGQEVLEALQAKDPELPVILLSGHADIAAAVQTMRRGAYDFLEKPYRAEHLVAVLDRAIEIRQIRREARTGQVSELSAEKLEARLIGRSAAIRHMRQMLLQLADLPVDVLITGEAGTGRRDIALCLRDFGARARKPYLVLPCAGWSEAALDMHLFGSEPSAPSNIAAARGGAVGQARLEQLQGGTLILSEIEYLPLALQARLIRILQDGVIERPGRSALLRPLDLRLIATSGLDLAGEVRAGRFRADLYYHLSAAMIEAAPLRARREDIALLFTAYCHAAAEKLRRNPPDLSVPELERMAAADWPGNLAQLRAVAERRTLALLTTSPAAAALPPLPERLAHYEAALIAEALDLFNGSSAAAADYLGVPRRTLNEKIARYGLRGE